MMDLFYKAFEEKHRGSRELIKSRLQVYVPFIKPLLVSYPAGRAIDLGCGRGEWLETLNEQGFSAVGVDLDDGMLQACRERSLNVITADAIDYLRKVPDSTICVVSGFHLAEHLQFEVLKDLVQQAKRVLVQGGLLILETPNPENIVVGTCDFYMDPTHQRPIPPELLKFLPEHYGFARSKVLRLQEDKDLKNIQDLGLVEVLWGVSPDQAVVAQKEGDPNLIALLNPVFEREYGVTLKQLTNKFQQSINQNLAHLETSVQQVKVKADETQSRLSVALQVAYQAQDLMQKTQHLMEQALNKENLAQNQLMQAQVELAETRQKLCEVHESNCQHLAELERTKQELNEVHQSNHRHWVLAEELTQQMQLVLNSRSVRLTAPLRWVAGQFRRLRSEGLKSRFKAFAKKALRRINHELLLRPKLRHGVLDLSHALGFYSLLKSVNRKLLNKSDVAVPPDTLEASVSKLSSGLENMSPRARYIYAELKLAIASSQKGGR